jgi:homoserine kinase
MDLVLKIPGSTANLGPGFDTLSLAVNIYLHVSCILTTTKTTIKNLSEMEIKEDPEQNLITCVISKVCQKYNKDVPSLYIEIDNEIPLERGLGSSSAAIIAGIMIADFYCDLELSKESMLKVAGMFETHLDNLAASLYGNLNVIRNNESIQVAPLESLQLIVFIPKNYYTNTKVSRDLLPKSFDLNSVTKTIQNCTAVILYLTTESDIRSPFQDCIHQPYRMIPGTENVFEHNCFISGSGPCIMHIYKDDVDEADFIYNELINKTGIEWDFRELLIDKDGAKVANVCEPELT